MKIDVINLNNYVLPNVVVNVGTKFILNGDNNSFFKYIEERYNGSPTNAGIIKSYVNYIIGQGLSDRFGINVNKYISKTDLRLICNDFKLYGQYAVQVIWSQGSKILKEEPKPLLIKHIPVNKIGFNQDRMGNIDGYWYSFDWENKARYKPQLFQKFDGIYKDNPIEIFYVKSISSQPYFATPDYLSGLQYAHLEEELSNAAINHVLNGFSAGKIINVIGGSNPSEELKEEYRRQILSKLTGSNNTNKAIISYSNGIEGGEIKVENLEPTQYDEIFTNFTELAERKIFAAHSVTNPILFGIRDGSGLGSNKDEMIQALKTLYQSNINPMREVIIDGLEYVLKFIEPNIQLEFKDFEELIVDSTTQNNPVQ